MLRPSTLSLVVLLATVILAGCAPISALEAPGRNVVRPPEILLPGPYEAPMLQKAVAPEAAMLPGSLSDHLRDLQIEVQRPVLSTSDILRGVYGPVELSLPIE
jgi:hypothetical protein